MTELREGREAVRVRRSEGAVLPAAQWGKQAEPITKMQKPLSVEESMKHIVTPVDFEVKVFVTEEKLGGKPIAMTWDEQGRLWVSVTVDYPNDRQPEGEGRDKIVVCEDTDGDGVCDKVTIFADKLSIPTSLLPLRGRRDRASGPVTLFLKDTDGDGKADVRQELFTRLGHERHARRAEQPALRLRQLDLRLGRLRRLPRHGRRRAATTSARGSIGSRWTKRRQGERR